MIIVFMYIKANLLDYFDFIVHKVNRHLALDIIQNFVI